MSHQILDGYEFLRNPLTMTIPESKKTVSIVDTYSGSAIFQWTTLLQGSIVILKWKWMYLSMYDALRTKYQSMDEAVWDTDASATYNVIVTNLKGEYFEAALDKVAYRANVELTLNIRSEV